MCAIIGFSKRSIQKEQALSMQRRTASRGPDMERLVEAGEGWLGFQRLSIMGLDEAGMQPFAMDGRMLVCNGEIYGFRRLRTQLEARGYHFQSGSDCEILLPLYKEYGLSMFSMLDAEYALILYDAQRGLIAARDPIGIRPLFYGYLEDGSIVFASFTGSVSVHLRP